MIHIIQYRASGHRLIRFTIFAGETILAKLNVVLNQVYLLDICCNKMLLFRGKTVEKFHLWVKEKVTTTYVASGWIAVQRFFRNMGWNMIGPSRAGIYWKLTLFWPNPDTPLH